jgi:hypothetical protein
VQRKIELQEPCELACRRRMGLSGVGGGLKESAPYPWHIVVLSSSFLNDCPPANGMCLKNKPEKRYRRTFAIPMVRDYNRCRWGTLGVVTGGYLPDHFVAVLCQEQDARFPRKALGAFAGIRIPCAATHFEPVWFAYSVDAQGRPCKTYRRRWYRCMRHPSSQTRVKHGYHLVQTQDVPK